MSFRDEIKVDTIDEEKTLLIVEDSIYTKLKYFLNYISNYNQVSKQNKKIRYAIFGNLEDAWDFYINHLEQIDIVLLDCAVPRKPNTDVAFYAGLEIMPRLINRKKDISIIFNTPAKIEYEGLNNPFNVIYVSKNRTVLSDTMETKCKRNSRLKFILDNLIKNNLQIHRGRQDYTVVPNSKEQKNKTH